MSDIYDTQRDRYPPLPDETVRRLELSEEEYGRQQSRELRCPRCGYFLMEVPADMDGVISIRCRKCKQIYHLGMSYFRRQMRTRRHIRWEPF